MRSVSRRSVLVGSVVVAGGTALGACTGSSSKGGGGAAGAPAGSGSSASAPAPASSPGAAGFRSGCSGVEWDLEAGPAVVRDGMTILRLSFSPVSENSVSLGSRVFSTIDPGADAINGIQLLSLASSTMYPKVGGSEGKAATRVSPGEDAELFPVFGAVPQDTGTVEVFLPHFGVVAGIPVVGEAEAGFDVAGALSGADPDTSKAGPYSIGSATFAADGSSDTRKDSASTTVTVSGDVTFASDSAELSGQADAVLASAVEQIKRFPSGGGLAITGHTDDVADDAHNQTLSEQRARAVSDRLKQLVDLSKWTVEATGKGEGEPRVPNDSDEHRQANRRVEIVLTPSNPAEGEGSRAGASPAPASPAAGSGPVRRGRPLFRRPRVPGRGVRSDAAGPGPGGHRRGRGGHHHRLRRGARVDGEGDARGRLSRRRAPHAHGLGTLTADIGLYSSIRMAGSPAGPVAQSGLQSDPSER